MNDQYRAVIHVIAAEIVRNTKDDPRDIAEKYMSSQGIRRSIWATYSDAKKRLVVSLAIREANKISGKE